MLAVKLQLVNFTERIPVPERLFAFGTIVGTPATIDTVKRLLARLVSYLVRLSLV